MKIPYLKEIIMGGELAKMAFDYMAAQAPANVKADAKSAWNTAVVGRFKAFKNWLSAAWSGQAGV